MPAAQPRALALTYKRDFLPRASQFPPILPHLPEPTPENQRPSCLAASRELDDRNYIGITDQELTILWEK